MSTLKKLVTVLGVFVFFMGLTPLVHAGEHSAFNVNITKTDPNKKEEIKKLQGFLINQGILKIDTAPTGIYGAKTKQAVKEFQKSLDLPQTGSVGPVTRSRINDIIEETNASVTYKKEVSKTDQPEKIVVPTIKGDSIILPNMYIPRVMFWWGKVNQHINTETGKWETDANGMEAYAGASVDHLTYCKMLYPNSVAVKEYMYETIDSWHDRGNVNNYTSTNMSYLCLQKGGEASSESDGSVLGVATSAASLTGKPLNFTFGKLIKAGSKDADVSKLQKVLIENGYLDDNANSGSMDEATVAALKDFQDDNGFEITGTLGPKTRALLAQVSRQVGPCAGSQQKIIVKKPNGGETYSAGQQVNVKWKTCHISHTDKVRIDLLVAPFPPSGTNGVGLTYTLNDGHERVTLPQASAFGGNPMSFGTNFKVSIWYPLSSGVSPSDLSDNLFTITNGGSGTSCGVGATPNVTVLSPNGGQSYSAGSVINFTWTTCNQGPSASHTMNVALEDANGFNTYISGELPANTTTFSWTIPAYITSGQYKARVFCGQVMSEAYCLDANQSEDRSDTTFSISAPIVGPSQVTTGNAQPWGTNTVQVNGSFISNDPTGNDTWFEYGTTPSFGAATTHMMVASSNLASSNIGVNISSLVAGTTYYYRFCAQNSVGAACGLTQSFVAQ